MALSDDERRRLDEMEAALLQDDPKLASRFHGRPHFVVARRGAVLGILGLLCGLGLLVLGISVFFAISLAGYAMMLIGALALHGSIRRVDVEAHHDASRSPQHPDLTDQRFVEMMEQQWRRTHPED